MIRHYGMGRIWDIESDRTTYKKVVKNIVKTMNLSDVSQRKIFDRVTFGVYYSALKKMGCNHG